MTTDRTTDRLHDLRTSLVPTIATLGDGLTLYDVELVGTGRAATLRVLVDREGGVDLEMIAAVSRAVSEALDAAELDTENFHLPRSLGGSYTLEVSSPGVERPLRRPEHFLAAVGMLIAAKYRDSEGTAQRVRGVLREADDSGLVIVAAGDTGSAADEASDVSAPLRLAYEQVTQAHVAFAWGGESKRSKQSQRPKQRKGAPEPASRVGEAVR